MRMYQIALFVICFNAALAIVGAMGIFHGSVPAQEAASVEGVSMNYSETGLGIAIVTSILTVAAVGWAGRFIGINVPFSVIVFTAVFAASVIPMNATLMKFEAAMVDPATGISSWPMYLNPAILMIVGFVFVATIVQVSGSGWKGAE